MSNANPTSQTAFDILESSEGIAGTIKKTVNHALSESMTKEQVLLAALSLCATVALYAIANRYSFSYENESRKVAFEAPVER